VFYVFQAKLALNLKSGLQFKICCLLTQFMSMCLRRVLQRDFTDHIIRDTSSFRLRNLRILQASLETHEGTGLETQSIVILRAI
jgi:hypothetical protein